MSTQAHATALLTEMRRGGPETIAALFPLVYDELQRLAHAKLRRERVAHTLDTAGLIHEAYLKLIDQTHMEWRDRAHFCALAARGMRDILVDYARRRNAQKRGGGRHAVTLQSFHAFDPHEPETLLALDDALTQLSVRNERMGRIVECRFFGGMNVDETAEALGLSKRTVEREWTRAKAYLTTLLEGDER